MGLVQQGEKVGLVFIFIGALVELVAAGGFVGGAFARRAFSGRETAGVVAGGDGVKAVVFRPSSKHAEFNFPVAHDIRVWGEPAGVAIQKIVDDFGAVIAHEIDDAKLDPEVVGHGAGVVDVPLPRAVADNVILVDPIFHVSAHEGVTLGFEQESSDGAIDAAGHGDEQVFCGQGHEAGGGGRGLGRVVLDAEGEGRVFSDRGIGA